MATNSLMTNYELAKWLAFGFGQKQNSPNSQIRMYHNYFPEEEENEVDEKIRICRWEDNEWVEPTYELFCEDMKSLESEDNG